MPFRPPAVGSPYDGRHQKRRKRLLDGEPLCRLCLSAGRTVAASVADHIVALEDGGTNEMSNLMPLCKRCHDAIKTPADKAARKAKPDQPIALWVMSPRLHSPPLRHGMIDLIDFRRKAHRDGMPIARAHALSLAYATGIAGEHRLGGLAWITALLLDDIEHASLIAARCACEIRRIPTPIEEAISIADAIVDRELHQWFTERTSRLVAQTLAIEVKGSQDARAGNA